MSYQEYISRMNLKDTRRSWIEWKVDMCGMTERQAIAAAYNPEWGYASITA
jgi:hypothetical protein